MDYAGALAHLDRHVNHEARAGRIDGLSLEPMRRLVEVLGDPQRAYRVVHITGTNGKGSVARIVTALLVEHGLSVGTYTSPHLVRVNERITWNGEPIDDDAFASAVARVADLAPLAGHEPSYFEVLTAAALSWFAEVAVDVAVVEVGLLGAFDATNVVDADVAVITNIGRDHTDGVGDWRSAVAREKAGIVKPSSFLVLGEVDPALRPVFDDRPHVGTWVLDEDFAVEEDRQAVGGHLLTLRTPGERYDDVFVPLHGSHQATNTVMAVAAAEAFFARPLDQEVVRDAIGAVSVPGRLEVVGRAPLVLLDGAHNPDGAAALAEAVEAEFDLPGRRILVVGVMADKDADDMLDALDARSADLVVCCTPPSPRGLPAADLADAARRLGCEVDVVDDPTEALERARSMATEDDLILVAGSLYVVGAVRGSLS